MKPKSSLDLDVLDLDREIESLLRVEPSPDFVPRVRIRIADGRQKWISGWTLGLTTLSLAVILAAVWISNLRETAQPPIAEISPAPAIQEASIVPDAPAPLSIPGLRGTTLGDNNLRVLVPSEEIAALQHLIRTAPIQWNEVQLADVTPQPLQEIQLETLKFLDLKNLDQIETLPVLPKGDLR